METFDIPDYALLDTDRSHYTDVRRLKGPHYRFPDRENEYVQVDLGSGGKTVTAVVLQGSPGPKWITKFVLNYSRDGNEFSPYVENGITKVKLIRNHWSNLAPGLFTRTK